jgi:hypothetical protein
MQLDEGAGGAWLLLALGAALTLGFGAVLVYVLTRKDDRAQ